MQKSLLIYFVKTVVLFTALCFTMILNAQVRLPEKPNRPQYIDYSQNENGFWYAIEASGGSSVIIDKKNIQWAEGTFTGGYRFSENLRIGVGLGVRNYFAGNDIVRKDKHSWAMPVFANIRGNLISHLSREFVPYWSFSIGTVVPDGIFVSPTFGLRIGQPRNSFLIGIAYTLGNIDVDRAIYSESINHFALKIGYEF